jgi:hypothetical protein
VKLVIVPHSTAVAVYEGVNELGVGHLFYQLYVPDPEFIHTFIDRPYGNSTFGWFSRFRHHRIPAYSPGEVC